jgi:hypothetical protein
VPHHVPGSRKVTVLNKPVVDPHYTFNIHPDQESPLLHAVCLCWSRKAEKKFLDYLQVAQQPGAAGAGRW